VNGKNEDPVRPELSLIIPARGAEAFLESSLAKAMTAFTELDCPFEIIVVPNAGPEESRSTEERALALAAQSDGRIRVVPHRGAPGKGAAVATGVAAARGDLLFFADADFHNGTEFFRFALSELRAGADFVTGNRRRNESVFDIPVRLIGLAYRRHRIGLLFNRCVRLLFPIQTLDTQAGEKAFTRSFGERAFGLELCPGFFFDIELFLFCRENRCVWREVPIGVELHYERSTVNVMRDAVQALKWLTRIWWQYHRGHYRL